MRAFVDLDGVLCATVAEMFKRFGRGKTPKDCQGSYDTSTILEIPDPWSQFGPDFFAEANWTPEGETILATVEEFTNDVYLCSTPTYEPSSAAGKLRWIRHRLPGYERRYVLTPDKHLLAGSGTVLVDDCEAQTQAFRAAGGYGLLVPRPWNRLHTFTGNIIDYLRLHLEAAARNSVEKGVCV